MQITRLKVDGTAARTAVERSRNAQLTYAPVGMSLGERDVPNGFHRTQTEEVIGQGREAFTKVGYALMHWDIHREAGFQVQPQHNQVRTNERVGLVLPVAPFTGVTAICKVVQVVAEGDTIGFAYGTLPGHPMRGEESFVLSHRPDDSVVMTVTAVSKPDAWFIKLAGPLAKGKQSKTTRKYLAAAKAIAAAPAKQYS